MYPQYTPLLFVFNLIPPAQLDYSTQVNAVNEKRTHLKPAPDVSGEKVEENGLPQ